MPNITDRDEARERFRPAEVVRVLELARARVAESIDQSAAAIRASKELVRERRWDMDHAEKANVRIEVDVSVGVAERAVEARRQIERLMHSPYFGRVDFRSGAGTTSTPYYIGLHSVRDPDSAELLIHDWRAPVSALYYDFESGEAFFRAPEGTVQGEVTGKRQYKIEDGRLQYMLESALNIGDDILQQELSRSADEKMQNIVATIQREQNAVIRNEAAQVLILQGVAGSGKTSIALHRVAFLLYRFKDTLSSNDVMILSPNKVFGDYISSVLPELGEEQVTAIDVDTIAGRFLTRVTEHETFSQQVTKLLDSVDEAAAQRIRCKATPRFVTDLQERITAESAEQFTSAPIERRGEELTAAWVGERFAALDSAPIFTRLERVADVVLHRLKTVITRKSPWTAADTTSVRKQMRGMFAHRNAYEMYTAFYQVAEREGLVVPLGRKKIEYADCLGLTKSYRSTTEITEFAQNISRNDRLTPIDRHGRPPRIIACPDRDDGVARALEPVKAFRRSDHRSMGIICTTVAQAESLAEALRAAGADLTLLDHRSTAFAAGVVVTSAHIAKGLEFDAVIAPHVDHDTYPNGMDQSMLYIACTRAMHELTPTHSGTLSPFLAFARASAHA